MSDSPDAPLPVYEIDCSGIASPHALWERYLASVPTRWPEDFGYTLDSFWDGVEWGGPGDPCLEGPCKLVFRNTAALAGLTTLGGKPFLPALVQLVADTKRIEIELR